MISLLVIALIAQTAPHDRHTRENRRTGGRNSTAGFAAFEAFPANGVGTPGVPCSTTPPTGARGEVLTFTRASAATCTRTATGGLATTGIADAEIDTLLTDVARVEYSPAGILGLVTEASAATNLLLRFIESQNAAWSSVGTPVTTCASGCDVTAAQTSAFTGTYATSAVMIDDNDGAASEGRSQSFAVAAGAAHTMHCLVKAVSLAEATISLDGTAQTITGLSATTWSIVQVTDASSSGTSIAAQILNGDAVGDTGTVKWGGCQVETGSVRTTIIPTAGAAVTRAGEVATFAKSIPTTTGVCVAATITSISSATTAGSGLWAAGLSSAAAFSSPYLWPYTSSSGAGLSIDGTGSSAAASSYVSAQTFGTDNRFIASNTGALWRICKDSTCTTTASGAWAAPTYTHVKFTQGLTVGTRLWTRVVVDPDWTRCGP